MYENVTLIGALLSVALPALTALVTARLAHPGLKAIVLLALSAAGGFITAWQADPNYDWKHGAIAALYVFGGAVLAHFGLLKPVGVTGSLGALQRAVPAGLFDGTAPTVEPRIPGSDVSQEHSVALKKASATSRRRAGRR